MAGRHYSITFAKNSIEHIPEELFSPEKLPFEDCEPQDAC